VHYFWVTATNVIHRSTRSSTFWQTQCTLVLWNGKCWFCMSASTVQFNNSRD